MSYPGGSSANLKPHSGHATTHALMHMTDARQRVPMQEPPPVQTTKYNLSVRSSISRTKQGKIEHLGSFKDRAVAILNSNMSSGKNFQY